MKNLFDGCLFVLLVLLFVGCKESTTAATVTGGEISQGAIQQMELVIDGNKKTTDDAALITPGFTGQHFTLSYLSEKEDVQFSISSYMQELRPGSYEVYECKAGGECDDKFPDNNQIALFGPYPKDPMPAMNLFRTAYYAPKLGLNPLTLIITSVKDEQQAGNPFKTKRVEGRFSSMMAYAEQEKGGYEWHVVGKETKVEGSFNVLCSMR